MENISIDLKRHNDENEEQYIWRLAQAKDSGVLDMEWDELASVLNKELRDDENEYTSSAYRKPYQQAKRYYEKVFSKMIDGQYSSELQAQKRELERVKIQFRDERNAWQRQNYQAARVEESLDILSRTIENQGKENFDVHDIPSISGNNDLLVMLTDLHIGQTFDSVWGTYNTDIAKERLNKYLNKIISIKKLHGSEKCFVSMQGDLISGSIHQTIQISNRENVIEQIKIAIELISSFCYELTKHFSHVYLYNVSGNHSRLVENKNQAVHSERLDDFIGWDIGKTLSHIDNFHMVQHRNLDLGITDIGIRGKSYIACHGDYDGFNKSGALNLSSMLGFFPYAILYGHMHTPSTDEINGIKLIRSGSLAGSGDDYTIEKRLLGKPSQTVMVCNDKGIECSYNVEF